MVRPALLQDVAAAICGYDPITGLLDDGYYGYLSAQGDIEKIDEIISFADCFFDLDLDLYEAKRIMAFADSKDLMTAYIDLGRDEDYSPDCQCGNCMRCLGLTNSDFF